MSSSSSTANYWSVSYFTTGITSVANDEDPDAIREEVVAELGKVWGWVLAAGILGVTLGVVALLCPIWTSTFVLSWIAAALLIVGCIHISGLWYAEEYMKFATFAMGVVEVIIAIVTFMHPFESLMLLTIIIAVLFMIQGLYRIHVATTYRDAMTDYMYKIVLAKGICNVVFSAIVLLALPHSSLFTIGLLVGVNLLLVGSARISLAFMARSAYRDATTAEKQEQEGKAIPPSKAAGTESSTLV